MLQHDARRARLRTSTQEGIHSLSGNLRPEEVGDAVTDGGLTHLVLHGFDRTLCGFKAGPRAVTEHDGAVTVTSALAAEVCRSAGKLRASVAETTSVSGLPAAQLHQSRSRVRRHPWFPRMGGGPP